MRGAPESIAGKALKPGLALLLLFFLLILALAIDGLGRVASAEPDGIANHVVISEVQIAGTTLSDEFVELYNPISSTITMSNWKLTKKLDSGEYELVWPLSGTIPAFGFYLIGSPKYAGTVVTDTGYTKSNYLAQDGAVVLYSDNGTTVVDLVGWGSVVISETATITKPVAGGSIERKANSNSTSTSMGPGGSDELSGNGYDSNDNSQDFVLRDTSQPQNSSSPQEPSVRVTAWPVNILADGVSTSTITATVSYTGGYVVNGTVVTFTTNLGHISTTWGIDQEVTGTTTTGVATATLTSGTVAGTATITATSDSISDTTTVEFVPGSPFTVTVTVDSSTISCCVTTTVRVTVTDEYANVVTDTMPVTLTTDLTADISPLTDTTRNGLVTATVHGDKAASGTITATTMGNISGTTALTVTYSAPCTLTLTSSPTTIVANGVDSATITATVIDVCTNPVPSTTVLFTTSLGRIGSLTTTKTTDVNGKATATLTGTKSGVATITATSDSVSGTTTVNFRALLVPVGGVTYPVEGSPALWMSPAALVVLAAALFRVAFVLRATSQP